MLDARLLLVWLLAGLLSCMADMAEAKSTKAPGIVAPVDATSIFAVMGSRCPGGSEVYLGPGQLAARLDGMIYCIKHEQVIVLREKSACPPALKSHVSSETPPPGVVWCEPNPQFVPPPLPPP